MSIALKGNEFRKILLVTIGVPILIMLVCGASLALMTNHLLYLMRQGRGTIDTISEARESQKLIIDMESGERGFKMTGDPLFLEPYNLAKIPLEQHLESLSGLVAADPERSDVTEIGKEVSEWENLSARWIQEGKYDSSPVALKEAHDSKALMDTIRDKLDSLLRKEEQNLAIIRVELDSSKGLVTLSGILALVVIMVLTAGHVWRQMRGLATSYEHALREVAHQKERFRVTLTSIGDAVVVTDVNGHTTFMNSEAERLTGWPFAEAKGKALRSIFRIINEETRRSVDDPVEKVFKEKRVVGLANHTLLLSKNGAEWPIEDSAAPIYDGADGGMVGVVLVFHDATEMRRAERILKTHAEDLEQKVLSRTLELQRTINELESFSYTVSHDLRAPLRAMQGYSTSLLEDYAEKWGGEERELLTRISKAAERLDVLIQDVLTYSKVSKDQQAIIPVDLDELVNDILTQYPTFLSCGAEFDVKHPLEAVLGHPSGLTQVVSNLLTNAVKFVPKDRTAKIKIWTESSDLTVKLSIEDNGIGIDARNHDRIFKMFEQVDGKRFEGTGMGLAIAKKAVENMQGWIGVESSFGNGTKMWIELLKARKI